MTTAAEAKRMLRPLLARNEDLALIGRLLVIKPIRHILRGVFIDASWDKNLFRPVWAAVFLFERDAIFSLNWSEQIYRRIGRSWLISDPGIADELSDAIERVALPVLRPIQTISDFVSFTTKTRFPDTYLDLYPHRKVVVDIARGDLDSAHEACELLASRRSGGRWQLMAEEYDFAIETLWPLVQARDNSALARMLHKWEAQAARREKLEGIWEPTPFPLESVSSAKSG